MLGAAAVIGREFLDRSVHDARALQSEFEVPVLGEISRRFTAPPRAPPADKRIFMSRIQDILNKAERDGNTRRTRGLSDEG